MASKKELRALITLAGKVDPSLTTALMKATGENARFHDKLKQTNSAFKKGTKYGSNFGNMLKASFIGNLAADAVGKLVSKVTDLASGSLDLASDLIEVQNVVDTTFGSNADKIKAWADTTLESYGITELQAQKWAGSMGAMLKSSGIAQDDMVTMSTDLAALAGDFASFYNLDHDEAWNKIRSGISGETEPLKELGINMSVANLEAYAMSKGINVAWNEMDQASQTLLRYNYLMDKSSDAQGDFSKTSDGYANQQRLFKSNLQDLAATISGKLLPHFTKWYNKANDFIQNIDMDKVAKKAEKAFDKLGDILSFVTEHMDGLIIVGGGVLTMMAGFKILSTVNMLMAAWQATTFAQTMAQYGLNAALTANPIGILIVAIGALVAAGIWLWKNWDMVSEWLVGLWQNKVLPFFSGIGEWFSEKWNGIVDGFKLAWGGISDWFRGLWDGIVNLFKGYINIYIKIFNFVINALNKIQFTVPDWVPLIGGKEVGINIPNLKEFAYGGIATAPSIFGEAGPEMAIPLRRSARSIGLLNQTAQLLGVGGNKSAVFNFYISDSDEPKTTAEYIKQIIVEYFEDEGRVSFA